MPVKSFSNSNDNKSSSTHINKKDEPVKAKKDTTKKKGLTEEEFRTSLAEKGRVQDSISAVLDAELEAIRAKKDSIRVSKGLKPYKKEPKVTELPLAKEETMPNAFQRAWNDIKSILFETPFPLNLIIFIPLVAIFILAYFFLRYIKRKRLIKAQIKPVEPPTIPQPTIEKATSTDTSGLKFCIQCGKQIHGSSKFCPHCGAEQW